MAALSLELKLEMQLSCAEQSCSMLQVLLSGSETTAERRVQIYTPDYLLNGKPRPAISLLPVNVSYNQTFDGTYTGVGSIDRVVLVHPSVPTHGNHFDQRSVVLAFDNAGSGNLSVTAPPNANIAPPAQYMLFILSGGVPSVAKYISLPSAPTILPEPLSGSNLTGTISGPTSAPLQDMAAQAPVYLGDPKGTASTPSAAPITASGSTSGTGGGTFGQAACH